MPWKNTCDHISLEKSKHILKYLWLIIIAYKHLIFIELSLGYPIFL